MSTIAQNEPTRVVVGVDTHRDTHSAVALDAIGRKLDQLTFATDSAGYRQLMKWANSWGEVVAYAVEGTAATAPELPGTSSPTASGFSRSTGPTARRGA
jgi:transposase